MMDSSGINSTVEVITRLLALKKKATHVEYEEALVASREAIVGLREQNVILREQNLKLQESLKELEGNVKFILAKDHTYLIDPDRPDLPLCPVCTVKLKAPVPLNRVSGHCFQCSGRYH